MKSQQTARARRTTVTQQTRQTHTEVIDLSNSPATAPPQLQHRQKRGRNQEEEEDAEVLEILSGAEPSSGGPVKKMRTGYEESRTNAGVPSSSGDVIVIED